MLFTALEAKRYQNSYQIMKIERKNQISTCVTTCQSLGRGFLWLANLDRCIMKMLDFFPWLGEAASKPFPCLRGVLALLVLDQ